MMRQCRREQQAKDAGDTCVGGERTCSETCLPEIAATQQRAPAGRAGRGGHQRVEEQRALRGDTVEILSQQQRVDASPAAFVFRVRTGVSSPVVRERKYDLRHARRRSTVRLAGWLLAGGLRQQGVGQSGCFSDFGGQASFPTDYTAKQARRTFGFDDEAM